MSITRRRFFDRLAALAALSFAARTEADAAIAEPVVLEFAIAGGRYYGLPTALPTLALNEPVQLRREPRNAHDRFAIAVYRRDGTKLGYIPRDANQTLARLMDAGWRTDAAISGFVDRTSLAGIALTSAAEGDPRIRVTLSRHPPDLIRRSILR